MYVARFLLFALLAGCTMSADDQITSIPTSQEFRAVAVNNVSLDIEVSAERVWQDIVEAYIDGSAFAKRGYVITALEDDPAAFRGGYHMILNNGEGETIDERRVYITELDEEERRTRIYAQYLHEEARGLEVYATYQAVPIESGARYILDSQARIRVKGKTKAEVQEEITAFEETSDDFLKARLKTLKEHLEQE